MDNLFSIARTRTDQGTCEGTGTGALFYYCMSHFAPCRLSQFDLHYLHTEAVPGVRYMYEYSSTFVLAKGAWLSVSLNFMVLRRATAKRRTDSPRGS